MTEYPQRVGDSWSERKRLIRFRRRREKSLRFWQEFKLVPRWLVGTVAFLYLVAVAIVVTVNLNPALHDEQMFPPELQGHPVEQSFGLVAIVTGVSLFVAMFVFLVGYVNRDAKRRGMNSGLWTLLVIVLCPAYFAIGFIIYFLMRQPLPYNCPQCASTVDARYNFCPNCKCDLHQSCPQCKQEVVESDKYCPYCAQDLRTAPTTGAIVAAEPS
jgi:multisubunit Na+/H+ antiporter MnhC subunit/RNA polymerase subunit RPABC4/transcription elongation factor Spt4